MILFEAGGDQPTVKTSRTLSEAFSPAQQCSEFLARSATAGIVSPNLWHRVAECSGATKPNASDSVAFEIAKNPVTPAAAPINFSRTSALIASVYGRIAGSGSCSCASAKSVSDIRRVLHHQDQPTRFCAVPFHERNLLFNRRRLLPLILQKQWQMHAVRPQSADNGVPMTEDQEYKIFKYGLSLKVSSRTMFPPNVREDIRSGNAVRTADQSSQEPIKLFQVHRTLIAHTFEH
jgi:hypothetical protein